MEGFSISGVDTEASVLANIMLAANMLELWWCDSGL